MYDRQVMVSARLTNHRVVPNVQNISARIASTPISAGCGHAWTSWRSEQCLSACCLHAYEPCKNRLKLTSHGRSFLAASSWHPRQDVANTSREIGRVGRRCYEDASDLSATSRACRARGLCRRTRHTGERAALLHGSRPQACGKLKGKVARHARHPRSILARTSRVSARMSRGCYEETASAEFKLNRSRRHFDGIDSPGTKATSSGHHANTIEWAVAVIVV